jgi:outer membrane biogenesis lipoprotein LolB
MQSSQPSSPRRTSPAIVTALVGFVVLTGCTQVTGAPAVADRAAQAWTDRLDGLAQEAAQQARERADDAYASRLTEQARSFEASQQARDRADQAWTDRLNGLAEAQDADR